MIAAMQQNAAGVKESPVAYGQNYVRCGSFPKRMLLYWLYLLRRF
jgi:hypothetical protein